MPLDRAVADALNAQLGRELEAHLQYLAVSSWFDEQGLPQLKGFYGAQAAEEHAHAMRFLTYVQDAGGPVAIPAVAAPKPSFESAEEAVAGSLEWESDVTASINALMDLAIEKRDHATQAFLDWFVTEQVEEMSTMSELLQVVRRAGEDGLLMVEDYIARRGPASGAPAPADGGAA